MYEYSGKSFAVDRVEFGAMLIKVLKARSVYGKMLFVAEAPCFSHHEAVGVSLLALLA